MEELIDLYDKNFKSLNKTHLRKEVLPLDTYRYVIHICIINKNGHMLIQRRSESRIAWAGMWDITVGGGVTAGDTPQQSATRELNEEIGLEHDFSNERPYFTVHFDDGFDDYFILQKDVNIEDVRMNDGEVCEVKWATKEEILQLIDKKLFLPYKKSIIELIFEMNVRGSHKN